MRRNRYIKKATIVVCDLDVQTLKFTSKKSRVLSKGEKLSVLAGSTAENRSLNEDCSYYLNDKKFIITWSSEYSWKIKSCSVIYNGVEVKDKQLIETENQVIVQLEHVDRHVFQQTFKVVLQYLYDDQPNLYETEYHLEIPHFSTKTQLKFDQIDFYQPSATITKIFKNDFTSDNTWMPEDRLLLSKLTRYSRMTPMEQSQSRDNRFMMLKYALHIECLEVDKCMEVELDNVEIERDETSQAPFFMIKITNLRLPHNLKDVSLCLIPMFKYDKIFNKDSDCIYTNIDRFTNGYLYFKKRQEFLNLPYHLKFVSNRITFRNCLRAVQAIEREGLQRYFGKFDDNVVISRGQKGKVDQVNIEEIVWKNHQIGLNREQATAVLNILNCSAYPFPFVIFGPPGTGKTSALVEAVVQILYYRPDSRILISAQSNSACDEIGVRLLKYISASKILRFFSPSFDKLDTVDSVLLKTSNIRSGKNKYPTYEEFYFFNVVIATLTTCGRFVQMNINRSHFDYVFVDEAAASTEPECLIPIMGLTTDFKKVHANLIFLGDHKQLGPIIKSKMASKLGLGESLMERIMNLPKYSQNPEFNPKYVTQLLDNYRSHPAILEYSNHQFYDGYLRAKADPVEINFAIGWSSLPNKNFPIILHSVKSQCEQQQQGFSYFNVQEVKIVNKYVEELLENGINGKQVKVSDIGIVSPYKAQRDEIKKSLREDAKDVEVGTAEYYQGREKKIIIISTVRSGESIGFLKDERRLNVALTRAKCLIILVCDQKTLALDSMWNNFIIYCEDNNCCI